MPTSSERFDAVSDATNLFGVSEVDDELTVTAPPAGIKAGIEERLTWDARLPHDLVTVVVAPDGTATLTGTVNRWSELRAAGEDALRGGAARVVNRLVLRRHPEVVAPAPSGSVDR